jgi:hypothetical protein
LRFKSGAQSDEQVAREKRFLNHLQLTPAQLFCANERQKTFKALALQIFKRNALLADLGVNQVPVAHVGVFF